MVSRYLLTANTQETIENEQQNLRFQLFPKELSNYNVLLPLSFSLRQLLN